MIKLINDFFIKAVLITAFSSCAILHHVQVGSIDNRTDQETLVPFDIKLSEYGVSTEDIGRIAQATQSDALQSIAAVVSLFQFGPSTGNIVYNEKYAENLIQEIYAKCPTGHITGLISIREMRKYPVISGEIIKVTGFCKIPKVKGS